MNSRESYLLQEVDWIENSGEMPEVAFYEALFYLTEEKEGPRLKLTSSDIKHLEDAAINRFKTIILRDLKFANRRSSIFRGLKRTIINYNRLKKFQKKKNRIDPGLEKMICPFLLEYIRRECEEISDGRHYRTINCTREELEQFADELGVNIAPEHKDICFEHIPLTFDEVYRATLLSEREDYPYKFIYDRGNYCEIVIFNEKKRKFHISLKVFCEKKDSDRKKMLLKTDAVYRSLSKSIPPWEIL
ncbi:MAG: hypothetical protein DRH21_04810 [Deltaproteobacteria bacterium]|nr:MAG: hypothetical protein DRH21_04810 [Deltaproteobacteria bacterium]